MRFDLTFTSDDHLKKYLNHLGLSHEGPSLDYLNRLIHAHQHRVPFETFTRIADYGAFLDHLMPLPVYIERLEMGYGGVCWTLARGFHWLIKQLGFESQYYYMDPGHVCVVVNLPEGKFYADVGYGAPFFKAKPLMSSFIATSPQEIFKYEVKSGSILVTRTPGPTKTLVLRPQTPAEINAFFEQANVAHSKFLNTLLVQKFENKKLLRLKDDVLTADGVEKKLSENERLEVIEKRFGIYPSFYNEAKARIG